MPKPELSFSHVGLFVTDLPRMEDFYTRVLGFTVTDRGRLGEQELVFLSRDPDEHHQIVLASGRPPAVPFNVLNQLSFRLPSLDHLRAVPAILAAEPVTDLRPVSHGNAWSVYFRDPEGNRVELFVDTPWHTPQPLREPLDLSQSPEEIMRRTEAECRRRPGFQPRAVWREGLVRRMGLATWPLAP